MRYVSETTLFKMFKDEGYPTELANIVISAITEEIAVTQWLTLEEFKAKPIEGWCFININGWVHRASYANGSFVDMDDIPLNIDKIDMVAPVAVPGLPK